MVLSGCATWTSAPSKSEKLLRKTRLSVDSVVLELIFVHTDAEDEQWNHALWSQIDEVKLDTQQRGRLLANGFRCGVVGVQMPGPLRELAQQQQSADNPGNRSADHWATNTISSNRRLSARSGRRNEIVTGATEDSIIVLVDEDGVVSGNPYENAQTVLATRVEPLGDGRTHIEFVPEIHYGDPQQKWVGRDGTFVLEVGKHRKTYPHLKIATTLAPGETVVITTDGQRQSLGGRFFGDAGPNGTTRKMLLVRLAHSRDDELFTEDNDFDSLATGQ